MPLMNRLVFSAVPAALLLSACVSPPPAGSAAPRAGAASVQPAVYSTDEWRGTWNGPEGTFLRLDGGGNDYLVTIRDLDRTRTFLGSRQGGSIQFERDGVLERIRHTDGKETGMKWLADYSNCLTVKKGEGYCRGARADDEPVAAPPPEDQVMQPEPENAASEHGISSEQPADMPPPAATTGQDDALQAPAAQIPDTAPALEPPNVVAPDAERQAPVGVGEEPDLSVLNPVPQAESTASLESETESKAQTPWGNPGSMATESPGF